MGGTFIKQTAINPDQSYLLLAGQTKRVKVNFQNSNSVDYDPVSLSLTIYKPDATQYFTEIYSLSGDIEKDSTGNYYYDFTGDADVLGDWQFVWSWTDTSGGESFYGIQQIIVAPLHVYNVIPYLRNQLDKAQKDLNTVIGYNDVQSYMYLKGGITEINVRPPLTDFTFMSYPWTKYQQLALDTATFVGLQAQGMLAIDTDANYSMQGNSFTIDHWSKISGFLSLLQNRINQNLKFLKINYITTGSVKVERGPGYRQASLFSASPTGTSFGNLLGVR